MSTFQYFYYDYLSVRQELIIPRRYVTVAEPTADAGKIIYNIPDQCIYYSNGLVWIPLCKGGGGGA